MAIIENKIQYDWVRKRVSKLKERVDETTPLDNRYRIELELLSKLEKEYSDEYSSVLEEEIKAVTNNVEKKQINIYEGLPMILEKIKGVALSAVMGKTDSWARHKLNRYEVNGYINEFYINDLPLLNNGLYVLGEEIQQYLITYSEDREAVIEQIRRLSAFISMPYIYNKIMGKERQWYNSRMLARVPNRKVCVFKEEDIHQINMAAAQIAEELKSIEFFFVKVLYLQQFIAHSFELTRFSKEACPDFGQAFSV